MRVLLAHKFFNITGGAEVFFHKVGDALTENGHVVAKFASNNEGVEVDWSELDREAHFVDYKNVSILEKGLRVPSIIYSKTNKERFKRMISDFQPDIVHVFSIFTTVTPSILDACSEMGVKVVMSCNDYKHICPNYKLYHHGRICLECKGGKFYNAIKNKCCKDSVSFSLVSSLESYAHMYKNVVFGNVDRFMFSSEFMASITAEFLGDNQFKYSILRNPFESPKYEYSTIHEDYILYFGRLVEEKGVDVLLKAMSHLPQIKLKVVGNGPDEEKLLEIKQNLNLENVEFLGPKYNEELEPILKACRFVVVPSLWHENYPYVINQSFAYGKAVIGSDKGGIPE
ncbi:MAG: glycosyltransferase, partial [Ekhidna sp.]